MRTFTLDSFLSLLRGTILHPVASAILPVGLIVTGLEPSPVVFGSKLSLTRWIGNLSPRLRWASWCVAAAWILSINRTLNKRALNPSRKSKPDLKRQVVVLTGGASGIGALLTQKLDAAGAQVVVLDVSPLTYAPGPRTSYFKCDISDASQVREIAAEVAKLHGAPTMLVANAGIVRGRNLLDATDEDLRLTFDVNVLGALWFVRAFLPDMITARQGSILFTASVTGHATVCGMADYGASKAAVNSIVEGLQTELKHQHGNPPIAVSAIYPGIIRTKMFSGLNTPDSFFLPVLEPEDVAERMFNILASGQSEIAFLPAASNGYPWIGVLPTWMRVGVQDLAGHAADKLDAKRASD